MRGALQARLQAAAGWRCRRQRCSGGRGPRGTAGTQTRRAEKTMNRRIVRRVSAVCAAARRRGGAAWRPRAAGAGLQHPRG